MTWFPVSPTGFPVADMFFVRRDGRVKGPLTRERLRDLRRQDRLRMRDEIAVAADGPWQLLRDVQAEVLIHEESAAVADDDFWREELSPDAAESPRTVGREGGAAVVAERRTWFERLRDMLEGDGAFREPFRPWTFLAAAVPLAALAAFVAVILVSPALEPVRRGPVPREGDLAAVVPGAAAAGADSEATGDGRMSDAPAEPGVLSALDPEHEPAIAALLAAYYAAADWQARYRLVVPGERTRRLLQELDAANPRDAGAVMPPSRWSLSRRLEQGKLAAAARTGQPVLVETSVDDHVHAVYVVFVEGRWRVDWLRSLERLWLTQ